MWAKGWAALVKAVCFVLESLRLVYVSVHALAPFMRTLIRVRARFVELLKSEKREHMRAHT